MTTDLFCLKVVIGQLEKCKDIRVCAKRKLESNPRHLEYIERVMMDIGI